jgi:hypothetical protein
MSAQAILPKIEEFRRKRAEQQLLEAIKAAVAQVSIKELAYELDVTPSLLADAMAERSNKGVRASWLITIIEMADMPYALGILNALGDLKRIESQPRQTLTPEERAERLEEKLRSLGPVGVQLIKEAVGS